MKRFFSSFLSSLPKPRSIPTTLPRPLHTFSTRFHQPHFLLPTRPISTSPPNPIPTPPDPISAFESATTTPQILSSFAALEASLPSSDSLSLGLACLKVGQHLDSVSFPDRSKTLSFAQRALDYLSSNDDRSITSAMALHLMGSVCYSFQRFSESLGYLNRAARVLDRVREDQENEFDVGAVVHAVQLQLANTKTAMGRREEALGNLKKCLELKEGMFGKESKEVGVAYRDLAEAYVSVLDFKQALPLCLRALEIHLGALGRNSVDVAHDRRLLAVVYTGLEEHQKALEQNQQSQKVMRSWGLDSDLLNAEIEAANMQIALGKYDEAIGTLRGVVQHTDKDSQTRALVFISMAKALCTQEKVDDAKRCLEISLSILEKKEDESPEDVAGGYADIAEMYESMNEYNTAISLLKKAASMFEKLPQEQYAEANANAKIGWLLLLTGKVKEGIPYLESAAERLKESFGPKHYAVGYIYNNLGAAYLELERPQSAAQMFALAKDIMDVSLGAHHADSIGACQNLANAYDAMKNYDLALEFQLQVVNAWAGHGPNADGKLKEAKNRLDELKKKMTSQLLDAWEGHELRAKDGQEEANRHSEEKVTRSNQPSLDNTLGNEPVTNDKKVLHT